MTVFPKTSKPTFLGLALLGIILSYTAWTHLPALDHDYLPGWDEAVHAAVAGNLAKHPLKPTLFDRPFIPYDMHNWQANHIWLHMPPLPFWQAGAAMAVGGRSFFSFRFPNLLLFMLTIGLVYVLGVRLYDEASGLVAAALLSSTPFAWLQVQGYFFGDMTDVSLAFWLIAGVLAVIKTLSTGKIRWAVVSGLFMGLGLLTKSALALAPTGALFAIWVLSLMRFRMDLRVRWPVPLVHLAVGLLLPLAWSLYSASQWPAEYQHEQAAQWAHVFSNYEGHGRPWDAVFNDLLAILLTPKLVLASLAGTATVLWLAFQTRRAGIGLHALWILGTLIPLAFVQTKVPALLFGLLPALALALACLFVLAARQEAGPWLTAAALTPLVFLLCVDFFPGRIWRFAEEITPAMAIWPHLPIQAMLFLSGVLLFWLLRTGFRRLGSPQRLSLVARTVVRLAILVPFVVLLSRHSSTRQGFGIIEDYNPVAGTVRALNPQLPDRAALIIEGVNSGRQRPDLTASVLTGHPAHTVREHRLQRSLTAAGKSGPVFLLTPRLRDATPLTTPTPGSGYWVYRLDSRVPDPVTMEDAAALASFAKGPRLIGLTPESTRVRLQSLLPMLAVWQLAGPSQSYQTQVILEPQGGGPGIKAFPEPENFPVGNEAEHLHNLAPPGLLWGTRPLGSSLAEPHRYRPGEIFADAFCFWVPGHLKPGKYRVRLDLFHYKRREMPQGPVDWPLIEIIP